MKKVTGRLKIIGSQESNWLGIPTLDEINKSLMEKLQALEIDNKSLTAECADTTRVQCPKVYPLGHSQAPGEEGVTNTWDLINLLAKTPAAITNLMRYYYEPTDEDRLLHRKLPSGFHRTLAKSIASRTGQIIITTNRDRLIEWGLASLGITPQVISSQNHLATSIPVSQTRCTLIKLNGDYLDLKQPQFENQFKTFLEDQIEQIYEPVFCRCCSRDRARLAQFNLKFN